MPAKQIHLSSAAQRGQIFSIDLILAMILVILAIGLLFNAANLRAFEAKEDAMSGEVREKAEAAAIALTNGGATSCSVGSSALAYSIDMAKINAYAANPEALKKILGLQGYSVQLSVSTKAGSSVIIDDKSETKNAVAFEAQVLACTQSSKVLFEEISNCMKGACPAIGSLSRQKVSLKVGR